MGNCLCHLLFGEKHDDGRYPANLINQQGTLSNNIQMDQFHKYSYVKLGDMLYLNTEKKEQHDDMVVVDDNKMYKGYVDILNQSIKYNDKPVTGLLKSLFQRHKKLKKKQTSNHDISEVDLQPNQSLPSGAQAEAQVEVSQAVIKLFIFFYTADQVYSKHFKTQVRSNKITQIAQLVASLHPYVNSYNLQHKFKTKLAQCSHKIYKQYTDCTNPTLKKLKKLKKGDSTFIGSFFTAKLRQQGTPTTKAEVSIAINPETSHHFLNWSPNGEYKLIVFPFLCIEADFNQDKMEETNSSNLPFKQINPTEKNSSLMISITSS